MIELKRINIHVSVEFSAGRNLEELRERLAEFVNRELNTTNEGVYFSYTDNSDALIIAADPATPGADKTAVFKFDGLTIAEPIQPPPGYNPPAPLVMVSKPFLKDELKKAGFISPLDELRKHMAAGSISIDNARATLKENIDFINNNKSLKS